MIRIPGMKGLPRCGTTNIRKGKSYIVYHRCGDIPIVSRNSLLSRCTLQQRSYSASTSRHRGIPIWATYDPKLLGTTETPYAVQNIVNGVWQPPTSNGNNDQISIPHPYNTDVPYPIFTVPNTTNIQPFVESLRQCPKTGLHNPYKNVERYVQYGDISRKVTTSTLLFVYWMNPLLIDGFFLTHELSCFPTHGVPSLILTKTQYQITQTQRRVRRYWNRISWISLSNQYKCVYRNHVSRPWVKWSSQPNF